VSEVLLFRLPLFRALLEYDGRRPYGLFFLWRLMMHLYLKFALLHPHFHVKVFITVKMEPGMDGMDAYRC